MEKLKCNQPVFVARVPTSNIFDKKILGQWPIEHSKKDNRFKILTSTLPVILNELKINKISCCPIQRFDNPYRVKKNSMEYYTTFNGCVFIDIDYDKIKNKPNLDPGEVYNYLLDNLINEPGFYYLENSLHKDTEGYLSNYHIIFYFSDCDISYYELYYRKAFNTIKTLLEAINADPDQCLDDNVANPSHLMFLTGANGVFNEQYQDYQFPVKDLEKYDLERAEKEHQQADIEPLKDYEWSRIGTQINIKKHLPRAHRWRLFCNLGKILKGEQLKTYWVSIINTMNPGKHPKEFYIEEPFKCNWIETISKVNLDEYLLGLYGINIHKGLNHQALREAYIEKYGDILTIQNRKINNKNIWKKN